MHTNLLADEKSPYLLQHAHNPVDWHPWGPEAFEKARREDKPIFLSIGYSTCHWCHVMERESFESEEIAAVLNRSFVPVKVDREERPDVDRVYMMFVQATSGSGGWPMSVWLTPDLKPFYGGTYFPPDNRYGRPGFLFLLQRLAEAWEGERQKILDSSQDVVKQLQESAEASAGSVVLTRSVPESGFYAFRRMFDTRLGGFGGAPKFPRPSVHNFLLRYYHLEKNEEALEMVLHTLRAMARGGMNDQLGGGFHRYSVDERWFVPHFEKMLYDQAQLAISYLEAYQITRDAAYAGVARSTLDYVLREMTDPEGGFYSAEDADSVIDPARPHEKGEGAFFIWGYEEVEQALDPEPMQWFVFRYGLRPAGNVEQDPHQEFTGKNILFEAHTLEETAAQFGEEVDEIRQAMETARQKLLELRAKRVRPGLDDKILTSWNALMISAFTLAGEALAEPRYREAARRAAEFIRTRLYDSQTGNLLRRYRDGEAAIPGFLDDYAFLAQAFLDLFESGAGIDYLQMAVQITGRQQQLFGDPEGGGFFATAANEADVVVRIKDDYDGAEPSGNSVAVASLLRLAQIANQPEYQQRADHALRAFAPRLTHAPFALPQMLAAYLFTLMKPRQIVLLAGEGEAGLEAFITELNSRFMPSKVVLPARDAEEREELAARNPALAEMRAIDGQTTAYVCENYACQLPVHAVDEFAALLR